MMTLHMKICVMNLENSLSSAFVFEYHSHHHHRRLFFTKYQYIYVNLQLYLKTNRFNEIMPV